MSLRKAERSGQASVLDRRQPSEQRARDKAGEQQPPALEHQDVVTTFGNVSGNEARVGCVELLDRFDWTAGEKFEADCSDFCYEDGRGV